MERQGVVSAIITQNVDTLHQKAGSRRVIDLHGRNDIVECLSCKSSVPMSTFQEEMLAPLNPTWATSVTGPGENLNLARGRATLRPDGDAALERDFSDFNVPACPHCKVGILKPAVVFFGDSVPEPRKQEVRGLVSAASGILVAGSSLWTPLPFRLIDAAVKASVPVAILNVGPTRACSRELPVLKIEEQCGAVLEQTASLLSE